MSLLPVVVLNDRYNVHSDLLQQKDDDMDEKRLGENNDKSEEVLSVSETKNVKEYINKQSRNDEISPKNKGGKQSITKQGAMTLDLTFPSKDAENSGKVYSEVLPGQQVEKCNEKEKIVEKERRLSDLNTDNVFPPHKTDRLFTIHSSRVGDLTKAIETVDLRGIDNVGHLKPGALTPLTHNTKNVGGPDNPLKMEEQFRKEHKTGVNTESVGEDLKVKKDDNIELTEEEQQILSLANTSRSLQRDGISTNSKLSADTVSSPGESSEQGTNSTYASQEEPSSQEREVKAFSNTTNTVLTTSVSSRWWRDIEYAMSASSSSKASSSEEALSPRKAFRTLEVPTVGRRIRHFPFSSLKVLKGSQAQTFYTRPSFRGGTSKYTINSLRSRSEEAESSIIRNENANLSSPTRSIPWINDVDQDVILSPGIGGEFGNSLCCSCGTCALCYKVLLLVLMVIFLALGSFIFYETEKSSINERDMLLTEVERTVKSLSFNCTAEQNNSAEVKRQLFNFGAALLGIKNTQQPTIKWTYKDTLLLSFSMISSTGISVSLSSSGKIFGIFYTLIGLPLSVMFVWVYSRTMSRFLKFIYMKTVPDTGRNHPTRRYSIEDPGYGELRQIPIKVSVPLFSSIFVILVAILHFITKGGALTCIFMFIQLVFLNSLPYNSTSLLTSTGSVVAYVIYGYVVFIITGTCLRLSYKPFKRLLPKIDIFSASLGFKLKSKISRAKGGPVNRMNSTQLSMKINELTLPTTFVNSRVMNLDEGGRNLGIMTNIDRGIVFSN